MATARATKRRVAIATPCPGSRSPATRTPGSRPCSTAHRSRRAGGGRAVRTLDPTTRRAESPDGREYTLSDTVGFVRHLPHQLVEAFRSTLEEVAAADLLVHVVDGSDRPADQIGAVRVVLGEIDAASVPELIVVNKVDAVTTTSAGSPPGPARCALGLGRTGAGVDDLRTRSPTAAAPGCRGRRARPLRPGRPGRPRPPRRRGARRAARGVALGCPPGSTAPGGRARRVRRPRWGEYAATPVTVGSRRRYGDPVTSGVSRTPARPGRRASPRPVGRPGGCWRSPAVVTW